MQFGKTLTSIFLGIFTLGICAQNGQILTFSDDFSTKELFAESWIPKGNVQLQNNAVHVKPYGTMECRREISHNFSVVTNVRPIAGEAGKTGFIGFRMNGAIYAIRTDGVASVAYRLNQKWEGTYKKIEGFQLGKTYELSLIAHTREDGEVTTFCVNGMKIADISLKKRADGEKPILWVNDADAVLDDFKVYKLTEGTVSVNAIVNSSFEYEQEGRPPFYMSSYLSRPSFEGDYNNFLNSWQIDKHEKVSGRQSLRLFFNNAVKTQGIYTYDANAVVGKPLTFSVYLKSDRDNFPVKLYVMELYTKRHAKNISLSKEWKRYEFTIPNVTRPLVRCGVGGIDSPGSVWADDFQMEISAKASPYQPSSLDTDYFSKPTPLPKVLPVTVKKIGKAPLMDAAGIDTWITDATKFGNFYFREKNPTAKTEAYVACDDKDLYFAIRAYVGDVSKIKAEKTDRDSFKIFGQDNIEVLLAPGKINDNYYQMVVSAANSNMDAGFKRNKNWNGEWSSDVKINSGKKSIDYMVKVPLAMTGFVAGSGIGINIGRYDSFTGEASCIVPANKINFHEVRSFPLLEIPDNITMMYALKVEQFSVNGQKIACILKNNTGSALNGVLTFRNSTSGKLAERRITLEQGSNTINISLPEKQKIESELTVAFLSDDKQLMKQDVTFEKSPPLKLRGRLSYYTEKDSKALFRIESNLPETDKMTARLSCGDVRSGKKAASAFYMELPLEQIDFGTHTVTLEMHSEGKTIAVATLPLIKKKYMKGPARVDYFVQCLEVDGKPVLPFMPLISVGVEKKTEDVIEKTVNFYADNGFRQCMLIFNSENHKYGLIFLKYLEKRGIKTIVWQDSWVKTRDGGVLKDEAKIKKESGEIQKYSNVIAFLVLDEPELSSLSSKDSAEIMRSMMRLLPDYPVIMNNTRVGIPNRFADYSTDVLMVDDYLTYSPETSIREVLAAIDALAVAGKETGKPFYAFLVGNNNSVHYREITESEQLTQTWAVVTKGVTGLAYFLGLPYWPGNWKGYTQANREIQVMTEVILSDKGAPAMVSDNTLPSMTRIHQGYLYVFIVNVDKTPNRISVTLPADYRYSGDVVKIFDNVTIPLSGRRFSEELRGESRHIYRIKLK